MRRPAVALTIVALALVPLLVDSCAQREAGPLDRKVMIVGIDGLEWDIMGPMIEAGRLPNFARLIDEGAWGELASLERLQSPIIWTSIATGKSLEKHGVRGFMAGERGDDRGIAITSNFRNAKTVWQILGEKGRTVGIVAWLVTWPAEPVNGYLVTDRLNYAWEKVGARPDRVTFPPELMARIEPLIVRTDEVSDADAFRLMGPDASRARDLPRRVTTLKSCIAVDESARGVALALVKERPVDFFAVYLRGIDVVCHQFWTDMFTDSGPPVDEADVRAFGETIARYYEYSDRMLGEFLDLTDDGWTVIVCSDHGHSGPKLQGSKYATGIAMHDPTGVILLWGRDIARRRELTGASVLDVTPTVLALFGLPVGLDMDGRVLTEALDPAFLERHPVTKTATYEDTARTGSAEPEPVESPVDEEVKERLRSLGYIE